MWLPWNRSRTRSLTASLREFVYLDEVSVYSLLASRHDGFIELDKTLSKSVTKSRGLAARVRGGGELLGSEIRSQVENSTSSGSQVVKKAIIQTAFKQLLEREASHLVVAESWGRSKLPKVSDGRSLRRATSTQYVISAADLVRGALVELEVELDTQRLFQGSHTVETLWEFFDRIPDLFPLDASTRAAGLQIQELFGQLLRDLVPIEARVVNFVLVEVEGESFLVSRDLIDSNRWNLQVENRPIKLVGVAEQHLFWRDRRRVLFSRSRYHVMARISRDGIHASWQPIKIADMLGRVFPQFDQHVRDLGDSFVEGIREGAATSQAGVAVDTGASLQRFAKALAARSGYTWTDGDSAEAGISGEPDPDPQDIPAIRRAAAPVVAHLAGALGHELDPELVSEVRAAAFLEEARDASEPGHQSEPRMDGAFLDSEIVAIYW